jgi:hypothetical protein
MKRFNVFMAVKIQSACFLAVTPFGLVGVYGRFRITRCLWTLLFTCSLTTCPYTQDQSLTEFSWKVHRKETCFKEPRLSVQTLYNLGHIYDLESPAQIRFCPSRSRVRELSTVNSTHTSIKTISIWSRNSSKMEYDWPQKKKRLGLSYRPAVFFRHLRLISL